MLGMAEGLTVLVIGEATNDGGGEGETGAG